MIVAYLRGFLKPHLLGVQSYIREQITINAIQRELSAELIERKAMIESARMPALNPRGQYELVKQCMADLAEYMAHRLMLSSSAVKSMRSEVTGKQDVKKMEGLVNVLRKTDFVDKMRKTMEANRKDFV